MRLVANRHTVLVLGFLLLFVLIQCQGIFVSGTANAAQVTEHLWGISQECHFPIVEETYSLDGSAIGFDDLAAVCKGAYTQGKQEKFWTIIDFEDTAFHAFSGVDLDVRFNFVGWANDVFALQLSLDGGNTWTMLEEFNEAHPPPAELTTRNYALTGLVTAPDLVNTAQIRIVGLNAVGSPEVVEIFLDGARLVVTNEIPDEGFTATPTWTVQHAALQTTQPSSVELTPSPTPNRSRQGVNRRTPTATTDGASGSLTRTSTAVVTATLSSTGTPTQLNAPKIDPTVTKGRQYTKVPSLTPTPERSPTPTAVLTDDLPAAPTATPLITTTPFLPTATPTQSMTPTATSTLPPTQSVTLTPTAAPTSTPQRTETLPEAPAPDGPVTPFDLDSGSPHGGFSAFTDSCAGCHRSHTSPGPHLQVAWPEEETCFTCHSGEGVAAMDLESAFTSQPNTGTAFYSHPVELTAGVHELSILETSSSFFGMENRHVECVDCHDPHDSGNEEYVPPALQDQVRGATGVYPFYDGQGAPVDFAWLVTAQYEYQLCYKCHSSYVSQPAYPPAGWDGFDVVMDGLAKLTNVEPEQVLDSRDMAFEFNPQNTSFHPVMAAGRNASIPADSFVPGWTTDSLVYCSDCHNNPNAAVQGLGPHGSRLHILNEQTGFITVNTGTPPEYTSQEVCFNCHRFETYVSSPSSDNNTNFRRTNRNLHQSHSDDGSCYMCHDSHGSEQLHLINLDASIDNVQEERLVFYGGFDGQPTNSQTFWQISPDGDEKTCFISCHGHSHTAPGQSYPNYTDDRP